MSEFSPRLKRFARRVRLVRTWRGLAIGACVGSAGALVWAALDWAGVAHTDWSQMGAMIAAGAILGALVNALRPIPASALAASIDRRAGLEDRLTTADERTSGQTAFDAALRADAESHLAKVEPNRVYPIRVDRWHGGTAALVAATAAVFLLGNTPILMNDSAKAGREAVKKEGQKVERIRKENLETPEAEREMDEAQRRLTEEMRRLQKDLEKARMSPEEAKQRANELAKKAQELAKQSATETLKNLDKAETALDKMQREQLRKMGMPNVDPQLAKLSPQQRQQAMQAAQQKLDQAQKTLDDLQKQLDALNQKLKDPNLSEAERKALEAQKKALEQQQKAAQDAKSEAAEQMEALKLSEKAQKTLQKMMEHPLYKELMEKAAKMRQNAQQAQQTGQPKLSKEEREELQRQLEELAKKLADDKAMEEYLQAMLDAMKNTGGT